MHEKHELYELSSVEDEPSQHEQNWWILYGLLYTLFPRQNYIPLKATAY